MSILFTIIGLALYGAWWTFVEIVKMPFVTIPILVMFLFLIWID